MKQIWTHLNICLNKMSVKYYVSALNGFLWKMKFYSMLTRLQTFEWVFYHNCQAKAADTNILEQRLSVIFFGFKRIFFYQSSQWKNILQCHVGVLRLCNFYVMSYRCKIDTFVLLSSICKQEQRLPNKFLGA